MLKYKREWQIVHKYKIWKQQSCKIVMQEHFALYVFTVQSTCNRGVVTPPLPITRNVYTGPDIIIESGSDIYLWIFNKGYDHIQWATVSLVSCDLISGRYIHFGRKICIFPLNSIGWNFEHHQSLMFSSIKTGSEMVWARERITGLFKMLML